MESWIAAPLLLCIGGRLADDSGVFFESWTTGSTYPTTLTIVEFMRMDLRESQTLHKLQDAFAGESQANRRYLCFAAKTGIEGEDDIASLKLRDPLFMGIDHGSLPGTYEIAADQRSALIADLA